MSIMTNKIVLYVELPVVSVSGTLKEVIIWTFRRSTSHDGVDINVNLASYSGHEEFVQFSIQRLSTLGAFVCFC